MKQRPRPPRSATHWEFTSDELRKRHIAVHLGHEKAFFDELYTDPLIPFGFNAVMAQIKVVKEQRKAHQLKAQRNRIQLPSGRIVMRDEYDEERLRCGDPAAHYTPLFGAPNRPYDHETMDRTPLIKDILKNVRNRELSDVTTGNSAIDPITAEIVLREIRQIHGEFEQVPEETDRVA